MACSVCGSREHFARLDTTDLAHPKAQCPTGEACPVWVLEEEESFESFATLGVFSSAERLLAYVKERGRPKDGGPLLAMAYYIDRPNVAPEPGSCLVVWYEGGQPVLRPRTERDAK